MDKLEGSSFQYCCILGLAGLLWALVILVVITSDREDRKERATKKINNIEIANIFILKQSIKKKIDNNIESHIYSINNTIQS